MAPSNASKQFSVFGLTLKSDFPFSSTMRPGNGPADLSFTCTGDSPAAAFWEDASCVFETQAPRTNGNLSGSIHENGECTVIRFGSAADYYLWDDRIVCHLRDPDYRYGVELWLLGFVFSYWLEMRGLIVLHASAAAVDGRTIVFLSSSRGGKSSLAAAFMEAGYPLVTDDVLALEIGPDDIIAHPSYPQMRMWPDSAERHAGSAEGFDRIVPHLDKLRIPVGADGFGSFADASHPVREIYIPDMTTDPHPSIEITPVDRNAALQELLIHSFVRRAADITPQRPNRLAQLTQIVNRTPIFKITYPKGEKSLARVRRKIVDQQGLPGL